MYTTCPKCSYERSKTDTVDEGTCPACGIIFSKWMKQQFSSPDAVEDHLSEDVSKKRAEIFNLIIDRVLFLWSRHRIIFYDLSWLGFYYNGFSSKPLPAYG
jgi:hypothetical protein